MTLAIGQFRRRFVNDVFVDVVAVPPVASFKRDYEDPCRKQLASGSTLTHCAIDSEYRARETPDWVYAIFGISRP